MEKNDYKNKIFVVLALAISVLGLSIGFAAYSRTLYIRESTAEINPVNNFTPNVKFKTGTLNCNTTTGAGTVKNVGKLAEEDTVWQDLSVSLSAPGDSVTCTVDVSNDSVYNAFLKEISFATVLDCTAIDVSSNNSNNIGAICGANGVVATVSDGNNSASVTGINVINNTTISENNSIISGGTGRISFKIEYSSSGNYVDEDILVTIPQLSLLYKSSND